ncbi:hypothetical protein Pint_32921 [Pistacia integerrima]|uniref:Uncharacterized protein n=1 Tax=Pistacia integerrima TaxID=434235 RepID=A0ACC0X7E5_9ROSI|nr:hypothetical protein Pint_32921 [Pistacia integerrima]
MERHKHNILVVQIYVDDIIFGVANEILCKEFSKMMQGEFEMRVMGELNYFLGLQIKQQKEGMLLNQSMYIHDLFKHFKMNEAKDQPTPMSTSLKLEADEGGKSVDTKLYRGMIGALLYLTASRPGILFSVCMCARFPSCPKESHLNAVRRILLNGYSQHS